MTGSVNWVPAETTLPCLLVQGSVILDYALMLKEATVTSLAGAVQTNFNPTGTPYPYSTGTVDTDTSDNYPSLIDGLIYASRDSSVMNQLTFHSFMCGGNLTFGTTAVAWTVTRDTRYYTTPPRGFYSVRHSIVAGTYR